MAAARSGPRLTASGASWPARESLDVSGHGARPDVFSLTVGERLRDGVTYLR
ncbi:hypothetical protein [Amycolatopsis sp. cmx-4-61]|uniref:hypothetical protein n=1 Tax=Amycolatopsis sp. cmx-4-61 TaxID=2790937 RepID=UPI00397B268B